MSLTRLRQLDPCLDWVPDDDRAARLDDLVDRLCVEAIDAPVTAKVAHKRRRLVPRLILVGASALAVAAGAAVVLPGGGGGLRPSDARAALVSAAEHTTTFTSGHVVWSESYDHTTMTPGLTTTNDVRYQGEDIATAYTSKGTGPDGEAIGGSGGFRFVGDRAWSREGDGPWRELKKPTGEPAEGAIGRESLGGQLAAADSLVDAVRAAPDVTSEVGDHVTTYRLSMRGNEIPGPLGKTWAGQDTVAPQVQLRVTVGENDVVRRFTLQGGGRTIDVAFSDLGADQGITAP